MLNSAAHEISLGQKSDNTNNLKFFHTQLRKACSAELSMKEVLKRCQYFKIYKQNKFHAELSWAWKKFYNFRVWNMIKLSGYTWNERFSAILQGDNACKQEFTA